MSNPLKPGWPDPSASPFALFGASPAPGTPSMAQGLAGGMEMIKNFWGKLPGGTALPGFLVPTVDVEELDKRISDLRAAESWLEVNLTMLRATIQGLEVQRHTIAAIQSLSAMSEKSASGASALPAGLPTGWPGGATTPTAVSPSPESPPAPAPAAAPEAGPPPTGGEPAVNAVAGLAASNWLGFMQEQFSKVAQAALAPGLGAVEQPAAPPAMKPGTRKTSSSKPKARRPVPRKRVAP